MHTNKSFAFLLGWYKSVEKKQIGCSDYKIAQKNQISSANADYFQWKVLVHYDFTQIILNL